MKTFGLALSTLSVVAILAMLVWLSMRGGDGEPDVVKPVPPEAYVSKAEQFTASLRLVDVTTQAGIQFRHVSGALGKKYLPETMGGGAAFFDFDNDGDQDLLFVNSCHWPDDADDATPATPALYANDGTGAFTDVTVEKGLEVTFYGMGIAIGDADGDGWDDVFFTAVGNNRLYRNDAGKRFVEITGAAGLPEVQSESFDHGPHPWYTSAAFLDYNNDGWLDLFVCQYIKWSPEIDLAQGFQITGIGRAYGPPTRFEGSFCRLYRNVEGRFEDVSAAAGVEVKNESTDVPVGKALAVTTFDMDRDGFVDVMVANDTVRNFLFHNLGNGRFEEIGIEAGVAFDNEGNTRGAMGADWVQLDGKGTQAIVVGNFANEITALYLSDDPLALGFTDDAEPVGIGNPSKKYMKFGVFFFDLDLDGRLEIFESNGHLEGEIETVQAEQTYEQPAQIFWNAGPDAERPFEELHAEQVGPDIFRPLVGRGATYADIDGDGDLDILAIANGGPARLFRNDGGNRRGWIRLKLKGESPNTNAFGSRVEADVGDQTLHATVSSGRSYLSQCEQVVTFGIGQHDRADEVRVFWPGKTEAQVLGSIATRTETVVEQP